MRQWHPRREDMSTSRTVSTADLSVVVLVHRSSAGMVGYFAPHERVLLACGVATRAMLLRFFPCSMVSMAPFGLGGLRRTWLVVFLGSPRRGPTRRHPVCSLHDGGNAGLTSLDEKLDRVVFIFVYIWIEVLCIRDFFGPFADMLSPMNIFPTEEGWLRYGVSTV